MASFVKRVISVMVNIEKLSSSYYYKDYFKRFLYYRKLTERDLVNLESRLGRTIFGPVPAGHRREFFNIDKGTWIWHEQWLDKNQKKHQQTTRYEVSLKGVLKVQPGLKYSYLSGDELANFFAAVNEYYRLVSSQVYTPSIISVG
jgi:hypothetical protein